MRRFIGYLALLGIGLCVPDGPSSNSLPLRNPLLNYSPYYNPGSATAPILSYSNTHGVDGSYSYSFTTGDGKQAQENGYLKDAYIDNIGQPQGTQVKEGSYSYVSPEGTPIQIDYVADENGFRHGGVHFTANGKGAIPASIFNPRFNYNNPYSNRNYPFGQYSPIKPYDPRYPNNPRYNIYNPYRPVLDDVKKEVKTLLLALTAAAVAADVSDLQPSYLQQQYHTTEPIPIVRQEQIINPDGSYKWNYETGNGISAEESGYIKNLGIPEQETQSVQGQYKYTAPDGQIIELQYVADENGFQPQGAHLPTPPSIPVDIQKALDYLATLPPQNQEPVKNRPF
nr:uncharacterized protein LOC116765490 [Danaus plexippus plexippus]